MANYVYIKNSVRAHYVTLYNELSSESYPIGSTWQDYLDNKYVPLSAEQVAFHESHPLASVKEVWDMELTPVPVPPEPTPEELLEQAKERKLIDIDDYNESDAVNSFTIGGQSMWLTVEEREQLQTQINAHEAAGRETMTRWFGGIEYTFALATWKQMLVVLELYAGDALNVTEAHKQAVRQMTSVEEVEAFDITADYPDKPNFPNF